MKLITDHPQNGNLQKGTFILLLEDESVTSWHHILTPQIPQAQGPPNTKCPGVAASLASPSFLGPINQFLWQM